MTGIKRDHLLTLRVSPTEMKRIKLCAKMMGCTVSEMVRTLVNQKLSAGPTLKDEARRLNDSRVGAHAEHVRLGDGPDAGEP